MLSASPYSTRPSHTYASLLRVNVPAVCCRGHPVSICPHTLHMIGRPQGTLYSVLNTGVLDGRRLWTRSRGFPTQWHCYHSTYGVPSDRLIPTPEEGLDDMGLICTRARLAGFSRHKTVGSLGRPES
ncbi:hypothetical protein LIA77_00419 [Sarocladium implicatum]|nr:hypothetical protein LIA77_00419 [Sarocladium implicatum]